MADDNKQPSWRERVLAERGDEIRARADEWMAADDELPAPLPDPYDGPVPAWRVGRSVGRTIYRMVGPEASKQDVLIGMMDTPELAAQVVEAVNAQRARLKHAGGNAEDCPICKWRRDLPYPFICPGHGEGK